MERAELVELFRKTWEAQNKYSFNANKLTLMAMQPNSAGIWEQYEGQLAEYKKAAQEATAEWTKAAEGVSTEELVSIISEVVEPYRTK